MPDINYLCHTFQAAAESVAAVVKQVDDLDQALAYAATLCAEKEACRLLLSGCAEPLSREAETLCETAGRKVMTAPNLPPDAWQTLDSYCKQRDIQLTDQPLRNHLAGIDVGITLADFGVAETGTLVIDSRSEQVRLATMISEIHVALLPVCAIVPDLDALGDKLSSLTAPPSAYLAFITGASRTADIERVLAIGVHGPLALHIVLVGTD